METPEDGKLLSFCFNARFLYLPYCFSLATASNDSAYLAGDSV